MSDNNLVTSAPAKRDFCTDNGSRKHRAFVRLGEISRKMRRVQVAALEAKKSSSGSRKRGLVCQALRKRGD